MPIEVSGATGPEADKVNGTYLYTEERLNGKTVYSKRGDDSRCLFFATNNTWIIGFMADARAGKLAGVASTEEGLSHPTLGKKWTVGDGKAWQPQPVKASVMVSQISASSFVTSRSTSISPSHAYIYSYTHERMFSNA